VSWGDFLGTGNIANQNKKFLSFEETKRNVHKLGMRTQREWQKYSRSSKRPDNIPNDPSGVYKNKGWTNWGDFLGTGNRSNHNRKYRSFEESRKFAHNLKLDGARAWNEWRKSGKKPDDIPTNPARTYKDSGWISWGDFLGTGNVRGHAL